MNGEAFREIVGGALALWQADAQACFDGDALCCRIRHGQRTLAVLTREHTALGALWRIESPGRPTRTHRCVVPALATLRDTVCPRRAGGRALFVPAPPLDGEPAR